MANYNINGITKNGLNIMGKGISGSTVRFTSVVIGDGYLPDGTDIYDLTALISPLNISTTITGLTDMGDGKVRLSMRVSSGNTAYYIREIGIYAKADNGDEQLYAYINSGNTADLIPASGAATSVEKDFNLFVLIGSTSNFTANITGVMGVSYDDFTAHKNAAVLDHPDGSVTTAKIADAAITNDKIASGAISEAKLSAALRQLINGKITLENDIDIDTFVILGDSTSGVKFGVCGSSAAGETYGINIVISLSYENDFKQYLLSFSSGIVSRTGSADTDGDITWDNWV